MQEFIQTAGNHMKQLRSIDRNETTKEEKYEKLSNKYIRAIDNHEEALEFRAMAGQTEHRIKNLYENVLVKIVTKFQNACDNDDLVLEIGAIALGEAEDDSDTSFAAMAIKACSETEHTDATDSESDASDHED